METSEGIVMRDFAVEPSEGTEQTKGDQPDEDNQTPLTFWSKYIRLTVSEAECRDHLALERTYLAYIRTATAYAQFGVTLAQLFRLNTSERGIGLPTSLRVAGALGATTEVIALLVLLTGTAYFIKQQNGLGKGQILSRGWHVTMLIIVSLIVRVAFVDCEA